MAVIGNLVAKMSLNTDGLKTGSSDAIGQLRRLEGSLGGIASAAKGFFALEVFRTGVGYVRQGIAEVNALRNEIDEVSKSAGRLGVTFQGMRELNLVGDLAGVDRDTIKSSMTRMSRGISEAVSGGGGSGDALKELGLDAQKLKQSGAEEALVAIAEAMSHIPNEADRIRLALEIFGKQGAGMLNVMEGGAVGMRMALQSAGSLLGTMTDAEGKSVERFNDSLTRMGAIWKGVKEQALGRFAYNLENARPEWHDYLWRPGTAALIQGYQFVSEPWKEQEEAAQRSVELSEKLAAIQNRGAEATRVMAAEQERMAKATAKAVESASGIERSIWHKLNVLTMGQRGAELFEWKQNALASGADPQQIEAKAKWMDLWSRFSDKVEAKQKRINDAGSMADSVKTPLEQHAETVDKLNGYFAEGLLTVDLYTRLLEKADKTLKEMERSQNPLIAKSEQLKEAIATPLEKLNQQVSEVEAMQGRGLLTTLQAGLAKNMYLDQYAATLGKGATEHPMALVRGTAEAYNASIASPEVDQKEQMRRLAEAHLNELRQQTGLQRQIAEQRQPKVATARR